MKPSVVEINLSDIVFDETIYPRSEHNPAKVQEYATNLDTIEERENYISIDGTNRLLDGRHRHLAYIKVSDGKDRKIKAYQYKSEFGVTVDSRLMAIRLNSSHGQQLTQEDKRRQCIALYSSGYTLDTIKAELSVSYGFAQNATKNIRDEEEKQRDKKIADMWMACESEQDIAGSVGKSQSTVNEKIKTFIENIEKNNSDKSRAFFSDSDFTPPLYNLWTFAKKTNNVSHFGNSEQRIVDNLLYLYTEPFDIVVDPFGGGGSTIDACKYRLRRYWTSDRKPIPEREKEIRKHDLMVDGLPPLNRNWSNVSLTYLDPPYWRQAAGQYSNDPTDLANMPLEDFTKAMVDLVKGVASKQSKGVIALIIQPTQWKTDDKQFADHVLDIVSGVGNKKLVLENRVSCPYSTEQYNAQQVTWAKENKKLLVVTRELIVWRIS